MASDFVSLIAEASMLCGGVVKGLHGNRQAAHASLQAWLPTAVTIFRCSCQRCLLQHPKGRPLGLMHTTLL